MGRILARPLLWLLLPVAFAIAGIAYAAYEGADPELVIGGGTGAQNFTPGGILQGNGPNPITAINPLGPGQLLIGQPGGVGALPETMSGSCTLTSLGVITCNSVGINVTAGTPNIVISPTPGVGTFTVGTTVPLDVQSGALPYAISSADATKTIIRSNVTTPQNDTIVAATGLFGAGYQTDYMTVTIGNTITPTSATIGGLVSLLTGAHQYVGILSDGANYHAALGVPVPPTQTGTHFLADNMTWIAGGGGGLGTVTSVGLSVPASSLFSVTGSPVTTSGTLAVATTGTSGGIPYFSSTSQLNSSALLTQNALTLGGGAGAAPVSLGSLGTTTTLLHGNASGAPTFSSVATADIAASAVTYAKIQNEGASSLLGNPTGSPAAPSEITLGSGLSFSGSTLTASGSGGTVTSVACGTGVTCVPSPITGSGTISLAKFPLAMAAATAMTNLGGL